MIIAGVIEVFSMCEHHMMPFFAGVISVTSRASMVMGISKLPGCGLLRAPLQIQER
jgi:GTP cyclohydrolase I